VCVCSEQPSVWDDTSFTPKIAFMLSQSICESGLLVKRPRIESSLKCMRIRRSVTAPRCTNSLHRARIAFCNVQIRVLHTFTHSKHNRRGLTSYQNSRLYYNKRIVLPILAQIHVFSKKHLFDDNDNDPKHQRRLSASDRILDQDPKSTWAWLTSAYLSTC
jgi:hypothetical protein